MKQLLLGIALLGLLLAPTAARADRYHTTQVQGAVECTSKGPAAGAIVSFAGTGYSSVTDTTGSFIISGVPEGTYSLVVQLYGVVQKTMDNIVVGRKPVVIGLLSISCIQPCSANDGCAASDYCAKNVGDCAGQGACSVRPTVCVQVYEPVCGCDGITYGNSCEAEKAGVNVQYTGACLPPPPAACTDQTQCAAAEYCAKAAGDCSGQGTCSAVPALCPMVIDQVCGCDGKTYNNDCEAAVAGVNVQYKGACIVPPQPAACTDSSQCQTTEYCRLLFGSCSGEGTCTALPISCTNVYNPVCGCNGTTYPNSCYAARADMGIYSSGACPPPPRFDY